MPRRHLLEDMLAIVTGALLVSLGTVLYGKAMVAEFTGVGRHENSRSADEAEPVVRSCSS